MATTGTPNVLVPLSPGREARISRALRARYPVIDELDERRVRVEYPDVHAARGWRIEVEGRDGAPQQIDVLVKSDYPFEHAVIGIHAVPPQIMGYSHRIADRTMCVTRPGEVFAIRDDESVMLDLVERARSILAGEHDETLAERNASEILEYWRSSDRENTMLSLLDDLSSPQSIQAWAGRINTWVGSSRKSVEALYRRRYASDFSSQTQRGVLLVANPEFVTTYETGADFYQFFEAHCPEQLGLLNSMALQNPPRFPVLVALPHTVGGVSLVGAWISRPPGAGGGVRVPGFRPGHAPPRTAARAYFTKDARLRRTRVQRIDARWLTTRGGSGFEASLSNKRIVVVGAGSLGGTLCKLLVKSGVRDLHIADPQRLMWDNIARHELGARYVHKFKAEALAQSLMQDYPYAEITPYAVSWQHAVRENPKVLSEADVVISATGSWSAEAQLNAYLLDKPKPGLRVFAWLEGYAAAAHCVALRPEGCLGCGMDQFGIFLDTVTEFDEDVHRVPGCAEAYQPYGEMDAMQAKAFIGRRVADFIISPPAKSVIETWIGRQALREQFKGEVRKEWVNAHGQPPPEGTIVSRSWVRSADCALCSAKAS